MGCLFIRPGSNSFPPVIWANHVYVFGKVGPRGRHRIFRDRLPLMCRFTKCNYRRQNGERDGRRWHVCVALVFFHVLVVALAGFK